MSKLDLRGILRNVLINNHISEEEFSLDGYKEGAICLEKTSEGYLVYSAKESKKYNTEEHEILLYACYAIISRVGLRIKKIEKLKSLFADNVILEALEKLEIKD